MLHCLFGFHGSNQMQGQLFSFGQLLVPLQLFNNILSIVLTLVEARLIFSNRRWSIVNLASVPHPAQPSAVWQPKPRQPSVVGSSYFIRCGLSTVNRDCKGKTQTGEASPATQSAQARCVPPLRPFKQAKRLGESAQPGRLAWSQNLAILFATSGDPHL
jgi:hypothetical protein